MPPNRGFIPLIEDILIQNTLSIKQQKKRNFAKMLFGMRQEVNYKAFSHWLLYFFPAFQRRFFAYRGFPESLENIDRR